MQCLTHVYYKNTIATRKNVAVAMCTFSNIFQNKFTSRGFNYNDKN